VAKKCLLRAPSSSPAKNSFLQIHSASAVVCLAPPPSTPAAGRPAGKRGGNNLLAGNTKWIDGQSAGCHDVIACRRHCRPTSSPPTPSSSSVIDPSIGNRFGGRQWQSAIGSRYLVAVSTNSNRVATLQQQQQQQQQAEDHEAEGGPTVSGGDLHLCQVGICLFVPSSSRRNGKFIIVSPARCVHHGGLGCRLRRSAGRGGAFN